jgi:hypothetical protein
MTLTVHHRFRGPAASGNGGYVSGLIAAALGSGPVTVTLRTPPPLDVPLRAVDTDGHLAVVYGEVTVAEAASSTSTDLRSVPPVAPVDARSASAAYAGLSLHPFPECFVCGPARAPGDGMRLFPGRLGDGRTACVWTVGADLADQAEFVWAALDCPGGWSAPIEGRPMVLGRMTGEVSTLPTAGEECVVMGLLLGSEGRKVWTATTAYGADGRELGRAHATWITLPAA